MYIEMMVPEPNGKDGQGTAQQMAVVRYAEGSSIERIEAEVRRRGLQSLAFLDREFFDDPKRGVAMCRAMRAIDLNVLWSARLYTAPTPALLREMRLAGCQRLEMYLDPDEAVVALMAARKYGFDITIRNVDGTPYATDRTHYSVLERQTICERLPGLHSVQFDLAVALYKAGRYREVMLPLGKAMTLRFPMNELCLNLLACLSAAKHYPDMAAGLLDQARYGCPHPIVYRNQQKLRSWMAKGGDTKGVRLLLDVDTTFPN